VAKFRENRPRDVEKSVYGKKENQKYGPMPNVMAALPNTGGALCSTPQFGYAVTLPRRETR